jgi:ribonucleoside-diphosphate reductase alpha chain
MQVATETAQSAPTAQFATPEMAAATESLYAQYRVIRRNGAVVGFEPAKIAIAMTKAFIAVNGGQGAASARVREQVAALTEGVVNALMRRQPSGGTFHIEDIQDQVELGLMPMSCTARSAPRSAPGSAKPARNPPSRSSTWPITAC